MNYKGNSMAERIVGDTALAATSTTAITMPWWLTELPQMLAPFVAVAGACVVLITLVIKVQEFRLNRIRERQMLLELEEAEEGSDA